MSDTLGMVIVRAENLRLLDDFGLHRAEFGLIEPEASAALTDFTAARKMPFGAHCPLFKPEDHPQNNALLACLSDGIESRRLASVELMEKTIENAAEIGGEYAVVHIQRPENFGGENPAGFTETAALDSARRSCETLLASAAKHKMPVFIENLFRNKSFFSPASHRALLDSFPELGFCLDIGHLDVDSREFGFPLDEFLDAVMPYIRDIHLQNSNSLGIVEGPRSWKCPVHPSQTVADGWLDIESILTKILSSHPNCFINFEIRINLPDNEKNIREGIDWIKGLIPKILGK